MSLCSKGFCVNKVDGVRNSGLEGSLETATEGLLFTIAVTSAISVDNTSLVRIVGFSLATKSLGFDDRSRSCAPA